MIVWSGKNKIAEYQSYLKIVDEFDYLYQTLLEFLL